MLDGIRAARLNRLLLPSENDGLACSLVDSMAVLETLARNEPSVAWVVWNNGLPALFSRFLAADARKALFADPVWLYANSTRPSGKAVPEGDGYRMSGRWSLVSGCELAEWMALMCLVHENGAPRMTEMGPEMRFLFVHTDDVEILDTWHVGGLRGTGSHDVVVDDLHVPGERTLTPADPVTIEGPLGHIPIVGTLALGYAAQMLGIAGAAIDATVDIGRTKVTPNPVPDMRDRPSVQLAIATASAERSAARAHLFDVADRTWAIARSGRDCELTELAELFASAWHVNETATRIVDSMYTAAGTTSVYQDCPLERISRDLRVMRQHVISSPQWAENAGRVRLGLAPSEPLFAV